MSDVVIKGTIPSNGNPEGLIYAKKGTVFQKAGSIYKLNSVEAGWQSVKFSPFSAGTVFLTASDLAGVSSPETGSYIYVKDIDGTKFGWRFLSKNSATYTVNIPPPAPTPTVTPTVTLTVTPTLTKTITPTLTLTPTVTPTLTLTPTPTITTTLTRTPTVTPTPTKSPTPTMTITPTYTQTITPTVTPTLTRTPTITPTLTLTPTVTPTPYPILNFNRAFASGSPFYTGTLDFQVVFDSPTTYVLRWGTANAMSIGGTPVTNPYGGFANPYVRITDLSDVIVDSATKTVPGGLFIDSAPLTIGGANYKVYAQDWVTGDSHSYTGVGVLSVPSLGSASFT